MKILMLLLLISFQVNAAELSKEVTNTCTYAGGIARETQNIRQQELDNWVIFEYKVRLIYKEDEGLNNLLVIAKSVYDYASINATATDVFNSVFDRCIGEQVTYDVNIPEFLL